MEGLDTSSVPPFLHLEDAPYEVADYVVNEDEAVNDSEGGDDTSVDLDGVLEDILYKSDNDDLSDCFLDKESREAFLSLSQKEQWKDYTSTQFPTTVTIDAAKATQWKLAKAELSSIVKNVMNLLHVNDAEKVTNESILMLFLGPESGFGELLKKELAFSHEKHLKFMSTLCVQAAYRLSSTALFRTNSLLKDKVPMTEEEYNRSWKMIAMKRKEDQNTIRTARGQTPLWELLESIVNSLLKSVSITGHKGRISIALDDDKIWFAMRKVMGNDLFNIKYTTHVKPNRKGIVAHTAVSTGLNIPLGIVFERTKDSTLSCFRRLLDSLFSSDGQTDLRNVSLHSDRGYMIPSIVVDYLLASGAEVCGTVKRMAKCWPFTYNQVLKENDSRTLVDVNGAPTLFLKYCKVAHRYLFMSAFRNGTQSVACAVSTLHQNHHWEGIALVDSEVEEYKRDKRSLVGKFFEEVNFGYDKEEDDGSSVNTSSAEEWLKEEKEEMKSLKDHITFMTIRQGKK